MEGGSCFCNFLWFILIGWHLGLAWCLLGCLWCITIVGIPFGMQAFKIGCFAFWPFGKEIVERQGGADCCECFLNFIWIIFGGLFLCIGSCLDGVILCITICGIPCGMQCFKLAQVALLPFGRKIVETHGGQINNQVIVQPTVVVQPVIAVSPNPLIPPQQPQYAPPPQFSSPTGTTSHVPNGNYI